MLLDIYSMFSNNLDTALQKLEHLLKSYLLASDNCKQNRITPSRLIFTATFVLANGKKITHSFWAILQYLSQYLIL